MTWQAHRQTDRLMEQPARQQAGAEQQQARIEAHRVPGERRALVESPGERPGETFGRARETHREAARATDPGVVRGVRPGVVPVVGGLLGEDVRLEGSASPGW